MKACPVRASWVHIVCQHTWCFSISSCLVEVTDAKTSHHQPRFRNRVQCFSGGSNCKRKCQLLGFSAIYTSSAKRRQIPQFPKFSILIFTFQIEKTIFAHQNSVNSCEKVRTIKKTNISDQGFRSNSSINQNLRPLKSNPHHGFIGPVVLGMA